VGLLRPRSGAVRVGLCGPFVCCVFGHAGGEEKVEGGHETEEITGGGGVRVNCGCVCVLTPFASLHPKRIQLHFFAFQFLTSLQPSRLRGRAADRMGRERDSSRDCRAEDASNEF
jgi:hypothetical protein